jgi:hypothetical protein
MTVCCGARTRSLANAGISVSTITVSLIWRKRKGGCDVINEGVE